MNAPPIAYEIAYDFDQGTYSTHVLDPDTLQLPKAKAKAKATKALGTGNSSCTKSNVCTAKIKSAYY